MAFSPGTTTSSSCCECECDTGLTSSASDSAVSDMEQCRSTATVPFPGRHSTLIGGIAASTPLLVSQDDDEHDTGYKASESSYDSDSTDPGDESEEEGEPPDLRPLRANSRHLAFAFLQQLKEDAPHLNEEAQGQAEGTSHRTFSHCAFCMLRQFEQFSSWANA